jgi:hypothetical protein
MSDILVWLVVRPYLCVPLIALHAIRSNVGDMWAPLAGKDTGPLDVRQNVRAGATLLKRIVDRLPSPSVERVATLYNSLAKEKVTDYGARVANVYEAKPW